MGLWAGGQLGTEWLGLKGLGGAGAEGRGWSR